MPKLARTGLGLFLAVTLASCSLAGCGGEDGTGGGSGGSGGSGATGTAGSDGSDGGVTWCQVRQVLENKCWRCHSGDLPNGAPFALVSYADTQVTEAGVAIFTRMSNILAVDGMPPKDSKLSPPPPRPSGDEKELITTWVEQGAAPVGGEECDL